MTRPPIVIVSGMPATGKTTLSVHLASALFLPIVAKDVIKESLCRSAGMPANRHESMALGSRAIAAMHAVTAAHLERGVGLVLEAAFIRGISDPEVARHLEIAHAVNVHCSVPTDLAYARYEGRSGTLDRHASHLDPDVLAEDGIHTWPDRYGVLPLGIPVLEVDTSDGYAPSRPAIVAWVEEQLSC